MHGCGANTRRPFDPRRHSSVLLNVNEKFAPTHTGGLASLARSAELPLRTLVVGEFFSHRPNTGFCAYIDMTDQRVTRAREELNL